EARGRVDGRREQPGQRGEEARRHAQDGGGEQGLRALPLVAPDSSKSPERYGRLPVACTGRQPAETPTARPSGVDLDAASRGVYKPASAEGVRFFSGNSVHR